MSPIIARGYGPQLFFFLPQFACAGTLLGLTAYHVHFTETLGVGNIYGTFSMFSAASQVLIIRMLVPVVVELLVTSALAVLVSIWVYVTTLIQKFK